MNRPRMFATYLGDAFVNLPLGRGGPPGARDTAQSLRHFGTIAFGREFMIDTIHIPSPAMGAIEAGVWFAAVPEVYRPQAYAAVERVFETVRGEKLDRNALYRFIVDLNDAVWRDIEPVPPC